MKTAKPTVEIGASMMGKFLVKSLRYNYISVKDIIYNAPILILDSPSLEVEHIAVNFSMRRADLPSTKVCIIVPVRNEAGFIRQTLDALRNQTDPLNRLLSPNTYEVVVLVNNSSDHSFQIVSNYALEHPEFLLSVANIVLPPSQAHIGTIRRLLMDEAHRRLTKGGNQHGIIASTDGDTMVDSHWVYHIIAEIENGNDAIGGRILTAERAGAARLSHLRNVTYRCLLAQAESLMDPLTHNPFPCHFQYFGANMAVTCKMYEQAGKLPVLPYLEDAAFHEALLNQDARIRNSFKVKVYTSTRTDGRVQIGFSEQLRKWQEEEQTSQAQLVEEVSTSLKSFSMRNRLRKCWSAYREYNIVLETDLEAVAFDLQVNAAWLKAQMLQATFFGSLWSAAKQAALCDSHMAFQPVKQAIIQLRKFIHDDRRAASQMIPAGKSRGANYVKV